MDASLVIRDQGPSLDPQALRLIGAYWRAANYLSVGQLYLYDNPLLREPLTLDHVKPLVVGHWGTTPGQNFIYAHLNRVIKAHDLDMIDGVPGRGVAGDGSRVFRRQLGPIMFRALPRAR
jgi:xylulose-5-phosphate/fructose-6-phosphate phosphoketolase